MERVLLAILAVMTISVNMMKCSMTDVVGGDNMVVSGAPTPCCGPPQMEFMVGELVASMGPITTMGGQTSVDFNKNMLSMNETVITEGQPPANFRLIIDYSNDLMYIIVKEVKYCLKQPAGVAGMATQCLPHDAVYVGQHRLGLATPITLDAWQLHYNDNYTDFHMTALLTSDCVSVLEHGFGKQAGLPFQITISMMDHSKGIRDPSVFDVPDYCHQGAPTAGPLPEMTRLQKLMRLKYSRKL